jgi:hypothetical protein
MDSLKLMLSFYETMMSMVPQAPTTGEANQSTASESSVTAPVLIVPAPPAAPPAAPVADNDNNNDSHGIRDNDPLESQFSFVSSGNQADSPRYVCFSLCFLMSIVTMLQM